MKTCDFLIIGGGIIGVNIAIAVNKRYPSAQIVVIDKEEAPGRHASGRNSGVIHAGFYYTPDSLKAQFTKKGNETLTRYCDERKLPINKCGKLVVARDESEHASLDELLRRGETNGVPLQDITAKEAREIEPRVRTFERAIFSPTTSSIDPLRVLENMILDGKTAGVKFRYGVAFIRRENSRALTTDGVYDPGFVINAAGLYADQVAGQYGFSNRYRILPFKGIYLYSDESPHSYRTNIYPVPDLRNPFLGVHFTVTVDGHAKIGPTAIPAFWRENYRGIENFNLAELAEILFRELNLFVSSNFDFRKLAFEEIKKYSRSKMVRLASQLAEDISITQFSRWGPPGIRAQLMDIEKKSLEMDFVVEGDKKSIHVLNAVSPAFTCAMSFSEYLCNEIEQVAN